MLSPVPLLPILPSEIPSGFVEGQTLLFKSAPGEMDWLAGEIVTLHCAISCHGFSIYFLLKDSKAAPRGLLSYPEGIEARIYLGEWAQHVVEAEPGEPFDWIYNA